MNEHDELIKALQLIADDSEFQWVAEIIDRAIKALLQVRVDADAGIVAPGGNQNDWITKLRLHGIYGRARR